MSDEKVKKYRWTQDEVNAVLNAFKHNIEEKTLPSTSELVELKKQNECLQNRSTATIKSWIHHYNSKKKSNHLKMVNNKVEKFLITYLNPDGFNHSFLFVRCLVFQKIP